MGMFRRHLTIVPSKIYKNGVLLRDPLMELTVHAFKNIRACQRWCLQNGWPASRDTSGVFSRTELREHEPLIPEPKL